MKSLSSPRTVYRPGITLLELTIVILMLLSLISILMISSQAWKRGSDRATCILKIRNMQVATRSYQNIYGFSPGTHPVVSDGTQDIAQHLVRKGYITEDYFNSSQGTAPCPGGGTYSTPIPDVFPVIGTLYMVCSLSDISEHEPRSFTDW